MNKKSSGNDLTSEEVMRFRKLESVFLSRCRHFGYKEIKTSTIEPLYIFTALGALRDAKLNRIYSFIDWDGWSGERVALKPDSTPCVARYWGDHFQNETFEHKLCYVENHFEWADSGDFISERWQCGVENIGTQRPEADIEIIYMALDILRQVGLKNTYLFLSYPSIIKEMVRALSLDRSSEKKLLETIREKRNYREVLARLSVKPEKAKEIDTFLSLPSESANYSANYLENLRHALDNGTLDRIGPLMENFISICRRLDSLECQYIIDFNLLGDLDYYTGTKFQILSSRARKSRKDILCSGGRYDNLIGNMWELSETVPAVGFALFIRNTIPLVPAISDKLQNICIQIGNISRRNVREGQWLSDKLSSLGFTAKISFFPVRPEDYDKYGLVIAVDYNQYPDGYCVLSGQKIGKTLLTNLFGESNDR